MNECQKVVYYSKEIKTNQSHLDWDNKGTKTCAENPISVFFSTAWWFIIKALHSKESGWLMQILHCFEFLPSKLAEPNSK